MIPLDWFVLILYTISLFKRDYPMKMKRFNKNLVVIAIEIMVAAFVCVSMWGCTDVDLKWEESRSGAKVVGFVDDSLVMVGDYRCWSEVTDRWNGEYIDLDGCGRERLCVYNYRVQEDGPRWCDSLSSEDVTGIFGGQMSDSVIWGGEVSKSVQLWKIGERPHEIKLKKMSEGCSVEFRISSLKQWLGGTFIGRSGESLAADGDTCNYAVLDTAAGTLTYKQLDKDLSWIKECNDVRAWGDDVVCMKKRDNESLNLLVNNEVQDSILVSAVSFWDPGTISFASLSFYGNLFYWAYVNSIDSEKWKIKLNPNVRPLSFPSFGELVDENKRLISY